MRRILTTASASALLLLLLIAAPIAHAQTITNVRLVGSSSNAGIVEVQLSTGTWGRLCNSGFDNAGASIVCAMLGFRPITGYQVTMEADNSSTPTAVAVISGCPRYSASDSNTWTLSTACDLTSSIPTACDTRTYDSAVICRGTATTSTAEVFTGTTEAPNMATIEPTNCENTTILQLLPGPSEGLVLIRETASSDFGTICSVGFGVNEASTICRMLCSGTLNAIAQSGKYLAEAANYSVALSGLSCPDGANHTNDCPHNGWRNSASPCSSALAVTVRCTEIVATAAPAPTATVQCQNNKAYVYFSISQVSSTSLLSLYGTYDSATCGFNVSESSTQVWAEIPYSGCNTVVSNNDTHTLYTAYLYKNVTSVSGVYFESPYIYTIVCAVAKLSQVTAQIAPEAQTVPPVSGSDSFTSEVTLFESYSSKTFSSQISVGQKLTIGSRVYLRVRTTSTLSVKLVVRNCYATRTSSGTGTPYYIVQNKCATDSNTLFTVDDKTVGINLVVMSFSNAAATSTQAYFFCDVTICSTTDTSQRCMQACGTTVRRRRRRRDTAESDTDVSAGDGPWKLVDMISGTSFSVSESRASAALVAIATGVLAVLRMA